MATNVFLFSLIKLVHVGPGEEKFAQNALFSRHPVMKTWPKDHGKFQKHAGSKFVELLYRVFI